MEYYSVGGRFSNRFQLNIVKPTRSERPGSSKKRIRSGANARERDRTQSVNSAFDVLRTMIPIDPPDRKLSKIETLQLATKYIYHLSQILNSGDIEPESRTYDVCIFCLTNNN
ncbi:Myc-type, basic helix-loop-helix (bHLH) domain [Cinara cedri]|uniref:Myc-type, basic helix-loop-helix (BHLH) domain n=1 Tax=Cinara cedri TaxID=506608 RepID=A0A5E4MSB0_9HEMI|nr:Myc-type, basic helix-loop-helix (bHLH) domain [Cinara cedri]